MVKFKSLEDKIVYMACLPHLKAKAKRWKQKKGTNSHFCLGGFREREHFSLDLRQIRPSAVFGTRRITALRGESFTWVLDLGSFLKLREVGVSPYLRFIPILSTLQMFESKKAVRGCLIDPKT